MHTDSRPARTVFALSATVALLVASAVGLRPACAAERPSADIDRLVRTLRLYPSIPHYLPRPADIDTVMAELVAIGPPAVPRLIPLVRPRPNPETSAHYYAAPVLGEIGDPRAVGPLVAQLDNDRATAVVGEALGKIGEPAVLPLIESLGRVRSHGRAAAARALGKIGDRRAVEPLLAALADNHAHARAAAAGALGEIGDPRAVEPLIRLLKDRRRDVLIAAAEALGKLGDPRAVEPLIPLLEPDPDPPFVYLADEAAAAALGKLGDPRAVPPLIAALKRAGWADWLHGSIATALGEIGDPRAIQPLIETFRKLDGNQPAAGGGAGAGAGAGGGKGLPPPTDPLGVIDALVAFDKAAVESLIAALGDRSPFVRSRAAVVLGRIGDPRAVRPLSSALRDADPAVRASAATALGAIRAPAAVEPLVGVLRDRAQGGDTNLSVITSAAAALARFDDPRAVRSVVKATKRPGVLCAVAVSVRGSKDPRIIDLLAACFEGKKSAPYDVVITTWAELGPPAVPRLIELLPHDNHFVGGSAAAALVEIGDPRAFEPLAQAVLEKRNQSLVSYGHVLKFFIDSDDPTTRRALVAMMHGDYEWHAVQAAAALARRGDRSTLEVLVPALKSKYNYVRRDAAEGLAELGDRRAVEPLMEMLRDDLRQDGDLWVPAQALAKLGDPEAVGLLIDNLKHPRHGQVFVDALAEMGGPAVEPLIEALAHERLQVRCGAAAALGRIGDPRAAAALVKAIDEGHSHDTMRAVRGWAAIALLEIGARRAAETAIYNGIFQPLVPLGSPAVPALIRALENPEAAFREGVLPAGHVRQRDARDPLTAMRARAAKTLGEIGDARAVPVLVAMLETEELHLRLAATNALGEIADPRAVDPLERLIQDEDQKLADAAVRALAKIGRAATDALCKAFEQSSDRTRELAAAGLYGVVDAKAVDCLVKALADKSRSVRYTSVRALGAIEDPRAVAPLIARLDDPDAQIRPLVAQALGRIADPRAAPALKALLEDPRALEMHPAAKQALAQLP